MPTNRSHETDAEVFIAMTIGGGLRPRMTGPDLTRPFEEIAKEIITGVKTTAGCALIPFLLSGSACNMGGPRAEPTLPSPTPIVEPARPNPSPTATDETPTPPPSPTPPPTPTEAPTPTATKTPEPKPTVEVVPTTESTISVREILAECPVQATFGGAVFALHPQIMNLPLSFGIPIIDIKINPTPSETLGTTSSDEIIKKVLLYTHWKAWQYDEGNKYFDQRKGVTFEDYQKMVDQGGDGSHKMWVITKKGEGLPNEEVVISPKTKIVTVYVNALKVWGETGAILYDKESDTLIFKTSPAEKDLRYAPPVGYRIWVSASTIMAEDPIVQQRGSTARKPGAPNRISEITSTLIPDVEHATNTPFKLVIK